MSSDARLDRLGLAHLKDKPEELARELERRLEERKKKERAYEEQQEAKRAAAAPDRTKKPR